MSYVSKVTLEGFVTNFEWYRAENEDSRDRATLRYRGDDGEVRHCAVDLPTRHHVELAERAVLAKCRVRLTLEMFPEEGEKET